MTQGRRRSGEAAPAAVPLPAAPPPEALAEIAIASVRAQQLALADRQLHFEVDERTGRVVIELRRLDGGFIGTLSGVDALDALTRPAR